MGRQLEICLTDKDVRTLEMELRKGEDFRIIQGLSENPNPAEAAAEFEQQQRMAFLVLADELSQVRTRPVPGKTLYRVDPLTSPVIEFSPCFWSGSTMRPGRLFFEPRYYEGTMHVEKSSRFLEWAVWVLATCRKVLTFDQATNAWWGKEAMRLRESSQLNLLSQ